MRAEHILAVGRILDMPTPIVLVDHKNEIQIRWENDYFNVTVWSVDRGKNFKLGHTDGTLRNALVYKIKSLNGLFLCLQQFLKG